MSKSAPYLMLVLLLSACFSLATMLQPRVMAWNGSGEQAGILKLLLGDGRKLFAEEFFTKADVSFHSGYYPSIFDHSQAPENSHHMTSEEGSPEEEEHERKMNFLGEPKDLFERFGRNFLITQHTHLEGGMEREILPWLKLSAELDPQRIDTYTVAAYWLRVRLGKVKEAEDFLRDGLRANPTSYEILFELGRLYYDNEHDQARARNLWELALRRWEEQQTAKKNPDKFVLEEIAANLGRLEDESGNYDKAIAYFQVALQVSLNPEPLQRQVNELKKKLGAKPTS